MISGRHRLFALMGRLSEGWPLSEKDSKKDVRAQRCLPTSMCPA